MRLAKLYLEYKHANNCENFDDGEMKPNKQIKTPNCQSAIFIFLQMLIEMKPSNPKKQKKTKTKTKKLSIIYFIFFGNIVLWSLSSVAKMLVAKLVQQECQTWFWEDGII